MRDKEENLKGITLIALVITIIVLLILAAVSIMILTGQNGLLNKAKIAQEMTNKEETKERIKLELMGTLDEKHTKYTNQDVINAVKEITGKEIAENTTVIQDEKGNDIDISDLWIKGEIKEETRYSFTINNIPCYFTDKDEGFKVDASGKHFFYFDEWLNNHATGVKCNNLGLVTVDGEMREWIEFHELHSEGKALSIDIDDLEKRIHYD